MHKMSSLNELSEVRAEIARLQLREARLAALLVTADTAAEPRIGGRPGWPLQRRRQAPNLHLQ